MSDSDEPDSHRRVAERLLSRAQDELGLSAAALRRMIAAIPAAQRPDERSVHLELSSFADVVMNRRPLADGVVDGFYSRARQGQSGEDAFAGGRDALVMHGYDTRVVDELPGAAVSRFLGLGNVWHGIDPAQTSRVVDVGCGSGVDLGIAAATAAPSAYIVGVDKRPDLLKVAANACPGASLVVGDISSLPLADSTFDVVLANGLPPLQRPATLGATAAALHALAVPGGSVSATVITASPALTSILAAAYPDDSPAFTDGLATLMTGKPTGRDVKAAFAELDSEVTLRQGRNPYRDCAAQRDTSLFTVTAIRR